MFKSITLLVSGVLAAGVAMADSSVSRGSLPVHRLSDATALSIANGNAPQAALCDNFGYVWNLSSTGRSGRTVNLGGTAVINGPGPAAGTLTLAVGLPTDVTAEVVPGFFCNQFHQIVVTWDKASGTFIGTAFAFGGCDGSGPTQLGSC